MNPLDMRGPEFLGLYVVLAAAAFPIGALLRVMASGPSGRPDEHDLDLDPYEVAYVAGGEELVVNAAVASLVNGGCLEVDSLARTVNRVNARSPDVHPLEAAVFDVVDPDKATTVATLRSRVSLKALESAVRPIQRQLVLDESRAINVRILTTTPLFLVLVLGIAKAFVGVSRGRPIGTLVILGVFSAVLIAGLYAWKPQRTGRGNAALAVLRSRNAALGNTASYGAWRLASSDLVLAIGLFGMGVLASATGSLASLGKALKPPPQQGGSFSGCGSSTSGCGSSCGGGCGGGCGGCGG